MQRLISLIFLLLIAGCQPQNAPQQAPVKTMMLKASGEVEALPNLASFRIQLTCLDKSVASSKTCLVEKSHELTKHLIDAGIPPEDLLTTSVSMHKSYSWNRNTRLFEGFTSATELYVTVKDLTKLDAIYTELLENRNLEIDGLRYDHAQLDSLKQEAYLKALNNAQALAKKLIEGLPESSTEILQIGNVEISASMPTPTSTASAEDMMVEQTQQAAKRAIAISKGTVVVDATLFVEFLIK